MDLAIIRRNGLGDLLCTVPLIKLCKEKFKSCHLTLLVDERAAPLVPYLKEVDETVVIPSHVNKYLGVIQTAWKLRHLHFEQVISARPTPMKLLNIFSFLIRARERIAYVDGGWHSRLINRPRLYFADEQRHQMVRALRLIDPGLEEVPVHLRPQLHVKPRFQFEKKTILVSVTNTRVGSQLDNDKTQRILNQMAKNHDFQTVVNCEPKDKLKAQALVAGLAMPSQVVSTADFDEFLGLIASVDGLLIGDGGIMHLAAAMNLPQVVLFGGTQIWEWAPLSEVAICLRDPHNVNFISEDEILKAMERIL